MRCGLNGSYAVQNGVCTPCCATFIACSRAAVLDCVILGAGAVAVKIARQGLREVQVCVARGSEGVSGVRELG